MLVKLFRAAAASFVVSYVWASPSITLRGVPATPGSAASQVLDLRLASFSFELAYFPTFAGNHSHPNLLTKELVQRLVERTGVGPDIRPGGITVDSSIFDPNASALELDLSLTGGIYRSTYGPQFFESYAIFPESTRFIVDVNLGNNSIDIAQTEIQAAIDNLGWDRIYSIELGNEPDQYAGSSRPSGWTSADYTAQFLNWTTALTASLKLPPRIFQAGAFAEDPTASASMTTVMIIQEGIDDTGVIKLFDQHTYQYSTCDPVRNALATLPALVNHQNITAYLDLWKPQIAAARSRGKEFVVGEYGSVSCSGKENVTDTFGQAIWLADTVLYGASLNISRMYLHQGATLVFQSSDQANSVGFSWYDLWYPVPSPRFGSARASPSFVAYLLITETVGSSGHSRLQLVDVPQAGGLAAYAVWDPAVRSTGLARLALINTAIRNETSSVAQSDAEAVTVDLSEFIDHSRSSVQVKRMTAPGTDSKDSDTATWAGQAFSNGTASGREQIEGLHNGQVTVGGSEAVLVFF
ncbi:glycoside hydrolase family 79 protein [Ramaria rubella]|nr:glycoside hydrolase family 79 protein [Ramaria rubella]